MSMKRILNIFRLDIKNSQRDKMILYILIAPVLVSIVLSFISPNFQNVSLDFALMEDQQELASRLDDYGDLVLVATLEELKEKVALEDDRIGVYLEAGEYRLLLEGDESAGIEDLARSALSLLLSKEQPEILFNFTDLGKVLPPMTVFSFSFVVIMSFMLGGMIIGFNIIDEKETGVMRALMITPISRGEFILGKSIIGIVVPIIHTLLAVLIFSVGYIDIVKLLIVTVASSLTGIVVGFLTGVMSSNQMSGIANMKISALLLLLPAMLAFVLPEKGQFVLYWAPTYWSFAAIRGILNRSTNWTDFLGQLFWICLTTGVLFLLLRGKIKSGLKSYQS